MPSRRIITTIIICFGIVGSIWLVTREQAAENAAIDSIFTESYQNSPTNDEWKNILINVNPESSTASSLLVNGDSEAFEETTLTAQLSRDLFSRYLLAVKNGQELSETQVFGLVDEVLATPEYLQADGPQYIATNLKISKSDSKNTISAYQQTLISKMNARMMKEVIYPITIVNKAIETDNEAELVKLNPLIATTKGIIVDLLSIEVPKSAVEVHLSLLNAYSNMLKNEESMKETFTDPVKSFVAINYYEIYGNELSKSLLDINTYFQEKLN